MINKKQHKVICRLRPKSLLEVQMIIKPGATKRLVILLWCLSVSGFLYYFSVSIKNEISLIQFINFSILLFGGGVAYHVTTIILEIPQNRKNYKLWLKLLLHLGKVFVGYAIAGGSLVFAKKFGGNWGWLLALVGIIIGYFWVMHYLLNLDKPIKKLLKTSNK